MHIDYAAWNAADWTVLAVVALSTLLSLLRGFTREALSLAAWFVALWGGRILAPSLEALLAGQVADAVVREYVAFGLLFLAILGVGLLLAHMVSEAVLQSPLSVGDRLLGLAFGFSRGILVVLVAVAFSLPWLGVEPWWQASYFLPRFALLADWTRESALAIAGWIGG